MAQVYKCQSYTVKLATFTVPASINGHTVVAAVTGKKIRVIQFNYNRVSGVSSTLQFKSDTTAISPLLGAQLSVATFPLAPLWFETAAGEALKVDNAAGLGSSSGNVYYVEV